MPENNTSCTESGCTRESCEGCSQNKKSMIEKTNELNSIKKVIGIVSGKGGVGKSFVTAMMSVLMNRKGYKVGIMDADVTGPSIPKMFGMTNKAVGNELGMLPEKTKGGLELMSINLLLDDENAPVIWRGPIISGVVMQFWKDVIWGNLDFLFIDMPPGTGDVPLTVFQSIPLDGIIIVTSPQELVSMIVKKAYNMAQQMDIPVLGIVENMSYVKCPDCGKEINIFGESKVNETAEELGITVLGRVPIDPNIATLSDKGEFESFKADYLDAAADIIENIIK